MQVGTGIHTHTYTQTLYFNTTEAGVSFDRPQPIVCLLYTSVGVSPQYKRKITGNLNPEIKLNVHTHIRL